MDVNLSHGPSYGHTLTWTEALKPATGARQLVDECRSTSTCQR